MRTWKELRRRPSWPGVPGAGGSWLEVKDKWGDRGDHRDPSRSGAVEALERGAQLDHTIVIFLSDNGGCAEGQPYVLTADLDRIRPSLHVTTRDDRLVMRSNRPNLMPGDEATFSSYGNSWADMSSAPFGDYKHWVHEGGIGTPFVVHWSAGELNTGGIRHQPSQFLDVMATILDVTGVQHPLQAGARRRPRGTSSRARIDESIGRHGGHRIRRRDDAPRLGGAGQHRRRLNRAAGVTRITGVDWPWLPRPGSGLAAARERPSAGLGLESRMAFEVRNR